MCGTYRPPASIRLPKDYTGNKGKTIYVSKQGDNSDGSSWQKALHTVQAALSAVPDERGGHQIIIRPDRYIEANLAPAFKGAAGSYNALIGDFDGSLGSGGKGWVLIDSGDPEKGFKSWDWWGSIRATDKNWSHGNNKETFSSIICDRWIFRNLYTAGGDGGFFWDLTDKSGEGFTVVVEDCVGTGRRIRRRSMLSHRTSQRALYFPAQLFSRARLRGRHGGCVVGRVGKKYAPNIRTPSSKIARWFTPTMPWPYHMPAIVPALSSSIAA